MKILIEKKGNYQEMKHLLHIMDQDSSVHGIMIYTCDDNRYDRQDFSHYLKHLKTPVSGGIYPNIIYDHQKQGLGSIILGFTKTVYTKVIYNIHEPFLSMKSDLQFFHQYLDKGKTFFVNFDGLSDGIEAFKEELFYTIGLSKNFIGGGTGNLAFEKRPSVISNEGLLKNAAVISLVNINSGVGVAHGWNDASIPLKVTESKGNTIKSLNWEPALKVYKDYVEAIGDKPINEENFFNIAKSHPFGIAKMESEMVVRDPISLVNHSEIKCIGAVPTNSFVYILKGNVTSLIQGSLKAKTLAWEDYGKDKDNKPSPPITLLIDCISRALYLGNHYDLELDLFKKDQLLGILSLGELANTGKSFLELYTKTSVVGILEA